MSKFKESYLTLVGESVQYFVNCKGQVRFIESTMVKGRAKTVIAQGGEADEVEQN